MTKFLLEIEEDYDFGLLGISCHAKDYRLCHELNKMLNFDLERGHDLDINLKKNKGTFAIYTFQDEENHQDYYLIANKGPKGFLIPELKTTDYLLMIFGGNYDSFIEKAIQASSSSNLIIASYSINPEDLKSKQNLLFYYEPKKD